MNDFASFLSNFKKKTPIFLLNCHPYNIKSSLPLIMGIVNITTDSFFDGSVKKTTDSILKKVEQYIADGAQIIDIGGESTRPYSKVISIQEEIDQILPIISKVKQNFDIPISIDSYKSDVAKEAFEVGATIVNDISGMSLDPNMESFIIEQQATIVLCHIQGSPQTMQKKPTYKNVVQDIYSFLEQQSNKLISKGLPKENICLDPGIGFGKNQQHNIDILQHLHVFKKINSNILIGLSRKSFIQKLQGLETSDKLIPSVTLNLFSSLQGATILRVHDVKETAEALKSLYSIFIDE